MAASAALSDTLDIHLIGSSVHIDQQSATVLEHLLLTRFHCVAQFVGLDLDPGPRPGRPHIPPEKRSEFTLNSGVKVSVWKADLTNFSAVAVVNAANSKLQHIGGLALALSDAGGPGIQKESNEYIKKNGMVKTGDAVALGAGNLKCKTLIHAVGPDLTFRPNAHEVRVASDMLERVIRKTLEIVEKKHLETVAIPAISSGIFNFPVAECADVIVSTVHSFYRSGSSQRFRPKEVFLVNNDDPTVKEMERACAMCLSQPASYSQAAASASKPQTRGAKAGVPGVPGVQFGAVHVLLRKGRLEEQKTHVIVNTIGEDRNLSIGQVSKMLLKKAGPELQQQIYNTPPSGRWLIITQGFGLGCKEVYHVCCPYKSSYGSDQALFRSVHECLWIAVSSKYSSIAFPAIGTGNLGFRDQEVAQIMLNATWDFGQKTHLPLEVHFVIFPSDVERFKAFEKEVKAFQPKAFQMDPLQNFSQGTQSFNSKPAQLSGPLVRVQSSSDINHKEAEAWLRSRLFSHSKEIFIRNNFIQRLGEKDLEELCDMEVEGVEVEEVLDNGHSVFVVSGKKAAHVAVAALRFELKLQTVQEEFVKEELETLKNLRGGEAGRRPVSRSDRQIKAFVEDLKAHGLEVIKAEEVENPALEKVFKLQKAQMPSHGSHGSHGSSDLLLQIVSAQFCDMTCRIGFRPECAPPDGPSLGEGLYFVADVHNALTLWTKHSDHFLYLFVAEVLKGRPGPRGEPTLVLAPVRSLGYDSVERSGVTVVFSHAQTLPRFLLTCRAPPLREATSV